MRLLHTQKLELTTFVGQDKPKYAILSHTWGVEEILFEDISNQGSLEWKLKGGFYKLHEGCKQAQRDGFDFIWIDTCCIDKSSSTELSEAINSMFSWYQNAEICYAYLVDVKSQPEIGRSRWFTRGWTLQELVAPLHVRFYNESWSYIGEKSTLISEISRITQIDEAVLRFGHEGTRDYRCADVSGRMKACLLGFCAAEIMSWAAARQTTREEDMAYSLLGLFDVHMPLLYGEGRMAFYRLQEYIAQKSDDQSILAWSWDFTSMRPSGITLFAPSPNGFKSVKIRPRWIWKASSLPEHPQLRLTTNGIVVDMLICPLPRRENQYLGILDCTMGNEPLSRPVIILRRVGQDLVFIRHGNISLYEMRPEWNDYVLEAGPYREKRKIELNLHETEMRRITILQELRGKRTVEYTLPPLKITSARSCDDSSGQLSMKRCFPDKIEADMVGGHAIVGGHATRDAGTLVFEPTASTPHLFVTWGVATKWASDPEKRVWCKVSIPRDITWATEIDDDGERVEAIMAQVRDTGLYSGFFTEWDYSYVGSATDSILVGLGCVKRRVTAQITPRTFLSRTMLELKVSINRTAH